jgi:hypothetical protein
MNKFYEVVETALMGEHECSTKSYYFKTIEQANTFINEKVLGRGNIEEKQPNGITLRNVYIHFGQSVNDNYKLIERYFED